MPLEKVSGLFEEGTKVLIAIGSWGDRAGFSQGAKTKESRALYAKNVAAMLDSVGADGVGEIYLPPKVVFRTELIMY